MSLGRHELAIRPTVGVRMHLFSPRLSPGSNAQLKCGIAVGLVTLGD